MMQSPFALEEDDDNSEHPTDEELMQIFFKLRLQSPDTYGVIAVRFARLVLEIYGN